jgi:FtsP/CotA-like multicopper oxidase with cupredoxin domain
MGNGMMGNGMMGNGMMGQPAHERPPDRRTAEVLATVAYRGSTTATPLPVILIPTVPLSEPDTVRQFTLNHGMGGGMVFLINGQPFDHHRIDTQVKLNTVEDWEIRNTGMMPHPFHIHTNQFRIISRNGQPEPYAAWKDVVSVSPGETVRIRIPFRSYAGKTVYHCHVLDHEDRGMMGILDIQAT